MVVEERVVMVGGFYLLWRSKGFSIDVKSGVQEVIVTHLKEVSRIECNETD